MPHIELLVRTEGGKETLRSRSFECEKTLAPSPALPYWVFWFPPDDNNKVQVYFLEMASVRDVMMTGDAEDEPKLASVTPLRKEEDQNRPV